MRFTKGFAKACILVYKLRRGSFLMKQRTWTFTSIENGQPVGTVRGLSHEEAVEAIRSAMYGDTPDPRKIAERKAERERAGEAIAA
jgi:hypothetical protein